MASRYVAGKGYLIKGEYVKKKYDRWGDGICGCGCGGKTTLYRGKHRLFISGHQARGENNSLFGTKHSEDTRNKIKEAIKDRPVYWLGRKHSFDSKIRMSYAQKHRDYKQPKNGVTRACVCCGKSMYVFPSWNVLGSDNYRKFCSQSCNAKVNVKGNKNPFYGKHHTKKTRDRLRQTTIRYLERRFILPTSIEKALIRELNKRKEYLIREKAIGKWCVDILLPKRNIIIFADGCYWHACPKCFPGNSVVKSDQARISYLSKLGYSVYCFWEHDIKTSASLLIDMVLSGSKP